MLTVVPCTVTVHTFTSPEARDMPVWMCPDVAGRPGRTAALKLARDAERLQTYRNVLDKSTITNTTYLSGNPPFSISRYSSRHTTAELR